jgi:hypothetical protein
MLNLRLGWLLEHGSKKLLQSRRKTLHLALRGGKLAGAFRSDGDIHDSWSHARGNCLHRVVERCERRYAAVVHLRCGCMSTVITGENNPAQRKDAYKSSSSAKMFCGYN